MHIPIMKYLTNVQRKFLFLFVSITIVPISSEDSSNSNETENDFFSLETYKDLGPFIAALFFIIFSLHLLLFPSWATAKLMQQYIDDANLIEGQVLSCELKPNSTSEYIIDVIYAAKEHKYADNPSLKFRNPNAYEEKQMSRRFRIHRELKRGEKIEMLKPKGVWGSRSGVPREVVENTLDENNNNRIHKVLKIIGGIVIVVILYYSSLEALDMDNPISGFIAITSSLAAIELFSFAVVIDQFLKSKRRRFQSARPMVLHSDVEMSRKEELSKPLKPMKPFSFPTHDFCGHARVTGYH